MINTQTKLKTLRSTVVVSLKARSKREKNVHGNEGFQVFMSRSAYRKMRRVYGFLTMPPWKLKRMIRWVRGENRKN